ncbi:hypothetical protein Gogos_022393 [Gossypium gossypioides]|uniref:Uncharacterized protein n=1 Tax=Gossypium gossypioides TaxID=34282 RepID=A0A7J9D5B8_GOSGO|nr:hypothetical protein [Gossypium gossypioides]
MINLLPSTQKIKPLENMHK